MCGICGMFKFGDAGGAREDILLRMADTLYHRGPDDKGVYLSKKPRLSVGLGHRRLSIIDLTASGHQPMSNEDSSIWVVFNGEIYNFPELKEFLIQKGHTFKSHTDTEVIIHLYEEKGEECLNDLRGMFAFAIWDGRKEKLFLARDRIGKKPLYYYLNQGEIVFGSEIKAILESGKVKKEINPQALDSYMSFLCVPAPMTIFKDIYKLPPAHYLVANAQGVKIKEYWDISFDNHNRHLTEDYYVEQLERFLSEAVKMRLISDVPLGAFLSGGIDSSAIVAMMTSISQRAVITNSIGFRERAFNELDFARIVAERFRTAHHEFFFEPDALEVISKLVWHFDEPFADASAIPTYYVSKLTRQNVTVALSGDGGDEIFAGYIRRYSMNMLENGVRKSIPASLKCFTFAPIARIYPKADWLPRFLRAKFFLTNVSLPFEQAYFRDMSMFKPEMKMSLYSQDFKHNLGGYMPFSVFEPYFRKAQHLDHLSRMLYLDIKTYLPNDILVKVDRMSMANSLEIRSPLLDHKFMEFVAQIPSDLKLKNRTSKYIFKKFLKTKLPEDIVKRPKKGFSVPLSEWFKNELRDLTEGILFSQRCQGRGYFDQKFVKKMWNHHLHGIRDFSDNLWTLLMLELWHQKFID